LRFSSVAFYFCTADHEPKPNYACYNFLAMMRSVTAVYENGVFRPLESIELKEGDEVEVLVESETPTPIERSRQILRKIASLPLESPDDGFSGADHDSVLYPKKDQ